MWKLEQGDKIALQLSVPVRAAAAAAAAVAAGNWSGSAVPDTRGSYCSSSCEFARSAQADEELT